MTPRRLRLATAGLLLLAPARIAAQSVGAAVMPDTVRVGDVFQAAVRVDLPPGHAATFPDSLALSDDVEQTGHPEETTEDLPDGTRRVTAVYPLSAWQPGAVTLPPVPVRLKGPDGDRTVDASLPDLVVRSILPDDTVGIHPRGLKDVLGPSRAALPLLLALLCGTVAIGGYMYWRRRGRDRPLPVTPPVPPRERALAALDEAHGLGLLEGGQYKRFYSLVTGAVRGYIDELRPAWGADLTTTELLGRTRGAMPSDAEAQLERLLRAADLVKFAKRRPSPEEAEADWASARSWVLGFGETPDAETDEPAEDAHAQEVA